jgi:hypothetical protein
MLDASISVATGKSTGFVPRSFPIGLETYDGMGAWSASDPKILQMGEDLVSRSGCMCLIHRRDVGLERVALIDRPPRGADPAETLEAFIVSLGKQLPLRNEQVQFPELHRRYRSLDICQSVVEAEDPRSSAARRVWAHDGGFLRRRWLHDSDMCRRVLRADRHRS